MDGTPCDLLIYGAAELVGFAADTAGLPSPERLEAQGVTRNGAVAVGKGRVLAVGESDALRSRFRPEREISAVGKVVVPGFVDAHTHPAFAVGRAEEFDWRAAGMGYVEIAGKGGGILSSVRAVRDCPEEVLTERVAEHFVRMQRHGTTACEAKSGYGLSTESELKSLRAIHAAAERTGMEIFPTFLGAHMVPEEFKGDPDRYVDVLCEESLPAVWADQLAKAADIYVEAHAFDAARARRYLVRAKELGFTLRVHAEQFENCGGTVLAAELGAESADHLEALDDAGLEALASSKRTFAGLLPCVPHFLRQKADAPARKILTAGVPYFVATDFNPGTSYTPSIPEAIHFARVRLRLSAMEALAGATLYAAASLGAGHRKGRLAPGYDADIAILDLPSYHHLGYAFGENPVVHLFARGNQLF